MNTELRHLVEARLESENLVEKTVADVVLSACEGREALEKYLRGGNSGSTATPVETDNRPAQAYLASITVEGFRGIGPAQTLSLNPGPGLTLVVGRNGSGKSSFAEALEVLFTGENKRWSERSKVWKEGWRNLHHPHPTRIAADLLLAGVGSAKVSASWEDDGELDESSTVVQPKGQPRISLDDLGWKDALDSYRPFLSYNELGSMLDEGPSKLYDALSRVLGLEDLVQAQATLSKARTEREKARKDANQMRLDMIDGLDAFIGQGVDERAVAAREALRSGDWGLDALDAMLSGSTPHAVDTLMSALQQTLGLDAPGAGRSPALVESLRRADAALEAIAGTDADRARQLAQLLEAALAFHVHHAGGDCPVCGTTGALSSSWANATRNQIKELQTRAAESARAHGDAATARNQALSVLRATPPKQIEQLAKAGIEGAQPALDAWAAWNSGATLTALTALADHIDDHHPRLVDAVTRLKQSASRELQARQDRWRPVAATLSAWIPGARKALRDAEDQPFIKEAEDWLKKASAEIRNERFAPIADKAMEIWRLLRQNSNVELGQVQLVGSGTARRVSLDVTVDGVAGAALGVMSQGELHSLALSLFLPRATLNESPFRFVVIDDPVQSMDPARVDGLARVLETVAATRQVVVLTHDDRLPDAVRRLGISATTYSVTRRPRSMVEIRPSMDPVRANIEDALALAHTANLPPNVLQRLVPGFCRSALEAAFMQLIRRRRLAAGEAHDEVEKDLAGADTISKLAALALFDDKERGGEVLKRLNQFGPWAGDVFQDCKEGAHGHATGDIKHLIENTEILSERILELK